MKGFSTRLAHYGPNGERGVNMADWTRKDYLDGTLHDWTSSKHGMRVVRFNAGFRIVGEDRSYVRGERHHPRHFKSVFSAIKAADALAGVA